MNVEYTHFVEILLQMKPTNRARDPVNPIRIGLSCFSIIAGRNYGAAFN